MLFDGTEEIKDAYLGIECNINCFDIEWDKLLGKGKYGTVYLALDKTNNVYVALKIVSRLNLESNYRLEKEIRIHYNIPDNEHIVKMYGYFYDKENLYITLEYVPGSDLSKYKCGFGCPQFPQLTEARAKNIIYKIILGIQHLHNNNTIHRDLKLENILIHYNKERDDFDVKICDFGHAAQNENIHTKEYHWMCGTVDYLSPERVLGLPYNYTVDIWCIGVLIYELLVGYAPFENKSMHLTCQKIRLIFYQFPFYANLTEHAKNLVQKILVRIPAKRPNLQEILQHPWFICNNTDQK